MKKLLYSLLAVAALSACCKDDAKPDKKVLNPFAQIRVHIRPTLGSRAGSQALSPRVMLEQATFFQFWDKDIKDHPVTRSIADNEKDFEKIAFKWWGFDVIHADTIVTYWRDARDLIVTTFEGDTIGYIPQSVRNEAFERILVAEKGQNYDLIYKIFEEAFVGVPCTAEEYKELKAKGLN